MIRAKHNPNNNTKQTPRLIKISINLRLETQTSQKDNAIKKNRKERKCLDEN